jgi:hypothetical protein
LTIASGGQSDAVIEIRSADATDAPAILQCLAAAFAPYRAEYTTAAYEDTVLTPETIHVRLQQRHILVATVFSDDARSVSLRDGRVIIVPLGWYPACATPPLCSARIGRLRAEATASTGPT